jgi:hypothetical protein
MAFMIKRGPEPRPSLRDIWEVGRRLKGNRDTDTYWRALDAAMVTWAGANKAQWEEARQAAFARLPLQAEEQIQFFERERARIEGLPHAAVVKELVVALKIEEKIQAIRETVII